MVDRFFLALGDIQIPLLAALLLGGFVTKVGRAIQLRSVQAALGPTALFPLRMQRPVAVAACASELGFGVGLILTSGPTGAGRPAELIRLGTGILFVIATCALIELRTVRPDVGCGCFGEFSAKPVDDRSVTRSALLAIAALETVRLKPITIPSGGQAILMLVLLAAEIAVIASISPEVKEAMVRLGYSEPCEIRLAAPDQTMAALRRSVEWRLRGGLVAVEDATDSWRELCWRYFAFPSSYPDADAEIVFAIYLESRHPVVVSVLVDKVTGVVIPWPATRSRRAWAARFSGFNRTQRPAAAKSVARSTSHAGRSR
jgi:hypothetical protein